MSYGHKLHGLPIQQSIVTLDSRRSAHRVTTRKLFLMAFGVLGNQVIVNASLMAMGAPLIGGIVLVLSQNIKTIRYLDHWGKKLPACTSIFGHLVIYKNLRYFKGQTCPIIPAITTSSTNTYRKSNPIISCEYPPPPILHS